MIYQWSEFYIKRRMMTLAIALYTGLLFSLPPVLAADDECAAHTRLNDADGSILNQAGLDRLRAGDNTGAEKFFRQSIGKDPGRGVFHNNLAVSLMRQGKYEEARTVKKSDIDRPGIREGAFQHGNRVFSPFQVQGGLWLL